MEHVLCVRHHLEDKVWEKIKYSFSSAVITKYFTKIIIGIDK